MAYSAEKDYSYTVGDIDEVVDERGNAVIMMRKLAWGSGKEKLEIRKWFVDVDSEKASKGVTFLTDDGPHNLTKSLIDNGYGDTEQCIESLQKRDDFMSALSHVIGPKKVKKIKEVPSDTKFYDPKELV